MEELLNLTEQPEVNPLTSTLEVELDKEDKGSYGKFKTAEELKTAYEKLEREFTRKSQKLKEMESKLLERVEEDKWAVKVRDLEQKFPVSRTLGEEITTYIKENKGLIEREDCLESALLHVLATKFQENGSSPTPRDKAPRVIQGGSIVVTPPSKPLTVKEANALATERLKQVKPQN